MLRATATASQQRQQQQASECGSNGRTNERILRHTFSPALGHSSTHTSQHSTASTAVQCSCGVHTLSLCTLNAAPTTNNNARASIEPAFTQAQLLNHSCTYQAGAGGAQPHIARHRRWQPSHRPLQRDNLLRAFCSVSLFIDFAASSTLCPPTLASMSFSSHPLPSPLILAAASSPLDGACSATSEAASQSCPQVSDVLLRPPIKKESLADRSDAIIGGIAFALAACALMAKWPLAQTFTHADATLLFDYTWSLPVGAIVVYLAMVHLLGPYRRRSNSKEPAFGLTERTMKEALKYWNLFLALLSLCMLLGMGIPLLQFSFQYGLEEAICDGKHRRWGGPAFVWMYVFTLSKYVELFDTAFMVLRRKPVSFLHWYHHTSVLAYTWFAVVVGFCPGWYFATINSAVHTIMYFYYYRSACGSAAHVRPTDHHVPAGTDGAGRLHHGLVGRHALSAAGR